MKSIFLLIISILTSNIYAGTFDNVITIFETKCQSCHNANNAEGNLNLTGTSSEIYNRLFDTNSPNPFSESYGNKIITPGYPERSTLYRIVNEELYHNITLQAGESAHDGLDVEIVDWEKELIRQWIYHGAQETGFNATGKKETLVEYYEEGGLERMERPEPPAEGEGFQLYLGNIFLKPNQEYEMVYKYELQNETPFEVNRIDAKMSEFSHHFLFFDYFNDEHEDINEGFRTIDVLSFILGSAISLGESGTNMIAGWAFSDDLKLPVGTAYTWEEDLVLKFNYHIKNYSTTQVYPAELYVNVYTQPTGTAIMEMHSDFLINGNDFGGVSIPANCDTIYNDNRKRDFSFGSQDDSLHIWNLGAHTHSLGVDYDIYTSSPSGEKLEQVYEGMYNYESDYYTGYYDYAEPSFKYFDDYLTIRKGDGLIQSGKFLNCTNSSVNYGLTTEDEMLGFFTQYLVGDITELVAYQDSVANVVQTNNSAINNTKLSFNVNPNPSNGMFAIELPQVLDNEKVNISVYDLSGKVVWQNVTNSNDVMVNLGNVSSGIYLVNALVNGKQLTQKITVK